LVATENDQKEKEKERFHDKNLWLDEKGLPRTKLISSFFLFGLFLKTGFNT